jgi:flagellar motor switch/type III secretory pathway protein FliN
MAEKRTSPRLDQVAELRVPLSVVLAERSLPLGEILELRPGAILETGRRRVGPLELRLNGAPVGEVQAVDLGERLGVVISSVRAPPAGSLSADRS